MFTTNKAASVSGDTKDKKSLKEFFLVKKNLTLRTAREVLLRSIDVIAQQHVTVEDLSADTLAVTGKGVGLRVDLSAGEKGRAEFYQDRDVAAGPWMQNQYALGMSFREALIQSDSAAGGRAVSVGDYVTELKGQFSAAVTKMTAENPDDRFADAKAAAKFVRAIGTVKIGPLLAAAGLFLCFAFGAVTLYVIDPGFSWLNPPLHNKRETETKHESKTESEHRTGAPRERPGMVLVRGGNVELDNQSRSIPEFYLDTLPVTVRDYEKYAHEQAKPSAFPNHADYAEEHPSHPVWNVAWKDARSYCEAKDGARLPTEAEWKRAVDSGYSWGRDAPNSGQANVDSGELADVGVTRLDKTESGIFDLLGNLPEWTSDESPKSALLKVVRGGGYYLPAAFAMQRLTISPDPDPSKGYLRVGFRCAADARGSTSSGTQHSEDQHAQN